MELLLKELKSDKAILETTIISVFKAENIKNKVYYGKELKLTHKQDVKVYDEESLLREFAKRKDIDYIGEFTKVKVDTTKYKRFAKNLYKDKKELLPGTEFTETDGITVTDLIGDILSI